MANYIVRECLTNTEYVVSADTLSVDTVVIFDISETQYCGTVVEETLDPHDGLWVGNTRGCCECLSTIGYFSFKFIRCGREEEFYVSIATFCENYGDSPTSGLWYRFTDELTGEIVCALFNGGASTEERGSETLIPNTSHYSSCDSCDDPLPRSASTETLLCEQICTESGTTVVSVVAPHPVWTDGYGTAVTQLNMITIGGNGLNG